LALEALEVRELILMVKMDTTVSHHELETILVLEEAEGQLSILAHKLVFLVVLVVVVPRLMALAVVAFLDKETAVEQVVVHQVNLVVVVEQVERVLMVLIQLFVQTEVLVQQIALQAHL
jgi:hypothetical protein